MEDDKKTPPTWEKNPAEFLKNLENDPVWLNTVRKESEMRQKYSLAPEPILADFPSHAAWREAWHADRRHFDEVTGVGARFQEIITLSWSGAFRAGEMTDNSFFDIASRMNYKYGDCTLDEVVAEWRKLNAN